MPKSRPVPLWRKIAGLLSDRKAEGIEALDFTRQSYFTDTVLIATAASTSHLQALQSEVTDLLATLKTPVLSAPRSDGGWLVVDAGSLVVHLYLKETRDFYRLEDLWGDIRRLKT